MDKRLIIIGIIMFTEVLGFSLILPFLPYYAESLGATPIIIGLIISSFSISQFISAPIIGKLSDRYGRKPLLIISQASTFIGFMMLGLANSLLILFLSRLIDGLFGSNMTLTNTYLTDITKGKERAKKLGYFGAIFGLGFFIGPAIGGLLAAINYSIPSFIAAGITLISILLTIILLPETIKRKHTIKLERKDFFPIKDLIKGLRRSDLRLFFLEFFLFILAFTTITSSLALYVKHQLGFGPEDVGISLMIIGLFRIIFQIGFLPKLIDRFSDKQLSITGLITLTTALLLSYFTISRELFYLMVILFSIGSGLTRPMMINTLSIKSRKNERGKLMGVLDSLASVSQMIGPLIGGLIIENYYPGTIGLLAGGLMILALITEISRTKNKKNLKKEY